MTPTREIPIGGYTKLVEGLLEGIEVRINTDYFKHKAELNRLANKIVYTGKIDDFSIINSGNWNIEACISKMNCSKLIISRKCRGKLY